MSKLDEILYAPTEPYASGMLAVGGGHELYWEQCGNPGGEPVLFLHGGPGSGCSAQQRRFFDPERYRVVLFDQRGSGRSRPLGELAHNSTVHLVSDIENLRRTLEIERWLVFGGSWGSSLALAYAGAHASAVSGMVLRGIFLTGRRDLEWYFQDLRALLPDAWERFARLAPKRHRRSLLRYYWRRLVGEDADAALRAARAYAEYEQAAVGVLAEAAASGPPLADAVLLAKYRLQCHYLVRQCFLGERRLLQLAAGCGGVPTAILHGRLDLVCRSENAVRLARTIRGARLQFMTGAGHSQFDPPMAAALVGALQHFAGHGEFSAWGESP
jgi:proline iminopeptidase